MTIQYIPGIQYDSNIYLILGKNPTIIDTGTGLHKAHIEKTITSSIDPKTITQIILTHEHYDHTGGLQQIHALTDGNATIIAHELAAPKIERGESMFARLLGGTMPKMPVDTKLKGEETLLIGDETYQVIHTPGHTPGCICLYSEKTGTLFSGDTVFAHGSFGRTDLPGGNMNQLQQSLKYLSTLPITNLYPGHDIIIEGNASQHVKLSCKNAMYY
jgi:glyoxylase-like metal-dependent hydrolase (beta-lactamase superfamily II)